MTTPTLQRIGITDPKSFILACLAMGIGGLRKPDAKPLSYSGIMYRRYHKPKSDSHPRQGEVTLKTWELEEAQRIGMSRGCVHQRFSRGQYPDLKVRRVNKRVVFVRVQP